MKPNETKLEFIRLRAEGRSFSYISGQLHISKSTCTKWERELTDKINELRREQFAELYTTYGMTKEARIKKLGETLNEIEDAISNSDISFISTEKLLSLKLKYIEALKKEFTGEIAE